MLREKCETTSEHVSNMCFGGPGVRPSKVWKKGSHQVLGDIVGRSQDPKVEANKVGNDKEP